MATKRLLLATLTLATIAPSSVFAVPAHALSGSSFNAARITDDVVFFSPGSMDIPTIQTFLNSKVPVCDTNGTQSYAGTTRAAYGASKGYPPPFVCLKDFRQDVPAKAAETGLCNGITAGNKSAAQILYEVGQSCGVSPKALIVLLQKEQTLVSDDWPWPTQYRSATGYGCPDTATCNSLYYGFFNQVYAAARQFKNYALNSQNYGYQAGRSNYIRYNPNASCGGSNVVIQNSATAALYNYTPYQPNQAALNNLYGAGDSCSAYGNRNFWRIYNDWFGPTLTDIVYAQANDGSAAQYLIYNGKKQQITTYRALLAWGVPRLVLQYYTPQALASIPNHETPLTMYTTPSQSGIMYFVDGSNSYQVTDKERSVWGGFGSEPLSIVDNKLLQLTSFKGLLPNVVSTDSNPNLYYVDQGYIHRISSPTILQAFAGQAPATAKMSAEYFATLPTGIDLTSPVATAGGIDYLLGSGKRQMIAPGVRSLLPSAWTYVTLGSPNLSSLPQTGTLGYLVRSTTGNVVYALDNGTKRAINSFDTFDRLRSSGNAYESVVDQSVLDLIPTGSSVTSSLITTAGKYYVANRGLHDIPATLQSTYSGLSVATTFTSDYSKVIPASSGATHYIKTADSPGIYFTEGGKRHPVTSYALLSLLGGVDKYTEVDKATMDALTLSAPMKAYVTDGTTAYLLDNARKNVVPSANIANTWELGSPLTVSADALNSFIAGGTVSQHIQTPNGEFCLADGGRRWCAESVEMIYNWNLLADLYRPSEQLLKTLDIERGGSLTPFAIGMNHPYSNTVFVVGNGTMFGIPNPATLENIGFGRYGRFIPLTAYTIVTLHGNTNVIHSYLATDDTSQWWLLDGGTKRSVPDTYKTAWSSATPPSALGTSYLKALPTKSVATKSVHAPTSPAIFAIANAERKGITTYQKYINGGYAPYTDISTTLLGLIPYTGDI